MKSSKDIIRRPIITEKATWLKDNDNKYVFEVQKNCNKIEIKKAVEDLFKVSVTDVRTYSTHGKIRTRGRFKGRQPDWKRAIVTLGDGDSIEFFEGV
ncbi:MAG: 50S ribosomal protein L23 [Candidatus Latescibacteria bacterium]|nr:50S ribosomal protein L23 [Candidatus Latescibacterota bacterium]